MSESLSSAAIKYFVHGILFSIIGIVLVFAWAALLIVLVMLGFIIGLIIGLVVLFFIMGGLNSFLTNMIWQIDVNTEWKALILHGLVLSILLFIVAIPSILINLYAPSLVTTMVLIVVYAFLDGYVAKKAACMFRKEVVEMVGETPKAFLKTCLSCGKDIPIASETCPHCGTSQPRS